MTKVMVKAGAMAAFWLFLLVSQAVAAGVVGHSIGWHGIVPLHSKRADVERLLGPPTGECRCEYLWHKQRVRVEYAGAPCQGYLLGWKVKKDTVLLISVAPASPGWSDSTGVDERRFVKKPKGDSFLLLDARRGIQHSFQTSSENGTVRYSLERTDYLPSTRDMWRRCAGFPPDRGGVGNYEDFDSFSDLSESSLYSHLDTFAVQLTNGAPQIGYVVAYAGKVARKGEALKLATACKRYLTTKRGLPSRKVVAVDGGFRNKAEIELYWVPKGEPPPVLQQGLPLSGVTIVRDR